MYDIVQDYYGRQLQSSTDLKTSACCDISQVPQWLKPLLARIHPEVLSRYYGCGLVCPALLEGCRVLDLGCGTGRDVYALAQLVGPTGLVVVTGLDASRGVSAADVRQLDRFRSLAIGAFYRRYVARIPSVRNDAAAHAEFFGGLATAGLAGRD